jgi:hypothetical protein
MCGARGGEYYVSKPRWSSGQIYAPGSQISALKGSILLLEFVLFGDEFKSSEAAMGGGEVRSWRVNEPKKTGARSARARTRGQNPLVFKIIPALDT